MPLMKHNILIILLMLMTFMSQASVSTSMYCVTDSDSNDTGEISTMMTDSMIDHSQMNHASMSHTRTDISDDCCQQDCQCPMEACFTSSLSASTMSLIIFNISSLKSSKIEQQTSLFQTQISSSLYRPPIT